VRSRWWGASVVKPSTTRPLPASSRKAQGYGLGLNWYWNRYVKVQFSYDQTRFERGAANGADRPDERVFFTRYQVAF
jgi:phosphate-selective porin OprO and OprP